LTPFRYIGEAENNLWNLFRDAEEEWKLKYALNHATLLLSHISFLYYHPQFPTVLYFRQSLSRTRRGLASSLHIVIFDEFDAIGRTRGTSRDASGVRDSCVNQLLTLLDGTRQMSNVLVIALTNRKDMLDPALLRPGRLEVHLEIGLPTTEGRRDILRLLFAPLLAADYISQIDSAVWIDRIVQRSDGANGADLAGIMRNAASHTIFRWQREHYSRAAAVAVEGSVPVPVSIPGSVSLTDLGRTQAEGSRSRSQGTQALSESSLRTLQARCEWTDFEKAVDTYKERD
jgi:SpoVK/Ycf46/Vps4 family AAA+-type ATPase